MSVLSPMFATQFKLIKTGELTRRITFPEPPNWTSLASRIESVYGIPLTQVAVSYIDKDGDEVTLNSQDELLDFFINCHNRGELVKFNVIDLGTVRATRGNAPKGRQDADEGFGATVPPSMLFDGIFGVPQFPASLDHPHHAFVEVIEEDDLQHPHSSPKGFPQMHPIGETDSNIEILENASASSSKSIIENEVPHKPLMHVFNVDDKGFGSPTPVLLASPRTPMVQLKASLHQSPIAPPIAPSSGPFRYLDEIKLEDFKDIVEFNSPGGSSRGKPLPKTPSANTEYLPMSLKSASAVVESVDPFYFPPVDISTSNVAADILNPENNDVQGSTANKHPSPVSGIGTSNNVKYPDRRPSLIRDVAELVDSLISDLLLRPDIAEKFSNILNSVSTGAYGTAESASIHKVGRDSFVQYQNASTSLRDIEHDAIEKLSEAFARFLGAFKEAINSTNTNDQNSVVANGANLASRADSHPRPQTRQLPFDANQGYQTHAARFSPDTRPEGIATFQTNSPIMTSPPILNGPADPKPSPFQPLDSSTHTVSYPYDNVSATSRMPIATNNCDEFHLTERLIPQHPSGPPFDLNDQETHAKKASSSRGMKAELEAAKAHYRAEKEIFRKEKEERRNRRHEYEEKLARDQARRSFEETVVARIPLGKVPDRAGPFFAEVYSVSRPSHRQIHDTVENENGFPSSVNNGDKEKVLERGVLRKLADMGFLPFDHPEIPIYLRAYKQINSEPTKENEEIIVTRISQLLTNL